MESYCSSAESTSSREKLDTLHVAPHGTHKVHYHANSGWDLVLDTKEPINASLVIPHYRARLQPVDHRLSMFVAATAAPVKLKICRPVLRCKFYLEVRASTSNVTIWLPSNFKGHIRCLGHPSFSPGFVNRIKDHVYFNTDACDQWDSDEVIVQTTGIVSFRMWDVLTNAPENTHKETLKRMFGYSKRLGGIRRGINWDFLLDD